MPKKATPVALITGGSKRIGATIAKTLHQSGMDVAIHYRHSTEQAEALIEKLESARPNSTTLIQANLSIANASEQIRAQLERWRPRLDLLVNNASSFYPTPVGSVTEQQWDDLLSSNLKGPFFLSQALTPILKTSHGCIINIVDIHGERPLKDHPAYSMAKAGNAMMVKSLAIELGPEIRVNGVAPGAILWPEQPLSEEKQKEILNRIPLQQTGSPEDIARTVLFLAKDAQYITGQIIAVDGGRSQLQ